MMQCGVNKVDEWNLLAPVQSSVYSSQYVEIPCYTSLPRDDQAALEFRLDKTDTAIDPSSMLLHMHVQIMDENGKPLPEPTAEELLKMLAKLKEEQKKDKTATLKDDRPAGVNLLTYSLFSSVEVFVSDQKINQGSSYYPWMCYVLNLLYQSPDAKNNALKTAGWYPDSTGLFDNMTMMNKGFTERKSLAGFSNNMELFGRVMLDTSFPARVLPVQTEFTLRFNRSNPNMCLMAKTGSYRIKINDAKIYALKMRLTDDALQRHHQILASEGVNYPMLRYETRTMTMMKGSQNLDWVSVSGVMPQKIYIWQLAQDAFNGQIDKNPYNFERFGMSKIQVLVNEHSMIASQPTRLDDDSKHTALLYMNTILNTTEAPFTYDDFCWCYCVIVVDLTRDRSAGCNYTSDPVTGNLRILMDYNKPLKESIVVFCMAEYNDTLHLDANRNPSWT